MVTTPKALRTDRVSNVIMELAPDGKGAVEWEREIERQSSEVTLVKLIVQPEAGVVPVIKAIKPARKTIDVFIFRFDRDEIEKALAAAVQRGVHRARADRAHQPRRRSAAAQARAAAARRRRHRCRAPPTTCSAITPSS